MTSELTNDAGELAGFTRPKKGERVSGLDIPSQGPQGRPRPMTEPAIIHGDPAQQDRLTGASMSMTKRLLIQRGPCEVCYFVAWEPIPKGLRCAYCYVAQQLEELRMRSDS